MPAPGTITAEDIEHRFTNHPPATVETGAALDRVTQMCVAFGQMLAEILPPGREASLAITNLEQVSMWAKAAIARNQGGA
jgi:hypothetical protein